MFRFCSVLSPPPPKRDYFESVELMCKWKDRAVFLVYWDTFIYLSLKVLNTGKE